MQYAEIVVNTKTKKLDQTFTYLIPPLLLPDIKPGILVTVPFRNKNIEGVVWSVKKFEKQNIIAKLKPIKKIITNEIIFISDWQKITKLISEYYFVSFSSVVFSMIPPIAKRVIDEKGKKITLVANQGKIINIIDNYQNRLKHYLRIIKKSLQHKKQILILTTTLNNNELIKILNENFSNKILIYDTQKTTSSRYKDWLNIKNNKYSIVTGTRSAIFSPLPNLGLIIVDDPNNFSYKEEQTPNYDVKTIAKMRQKLEQINLIFGTSLPSPEDIYEIENKKQKTLVNKYAFSCLELIDTSSKKQIISWELENKIRETLIKKQKTLLFCQRKGTGWAYICQDCNWEAKCPHCKNTLIPRNNALFCNYCKKIISGPDNCPNCGSIRLKSIGLGIDKVAKVISNIFPQAKVLTIDQNINKTMINFKNFDILIGTKKILDISDIKVKLAGIISFDNLLNLPDYKINYELLNTIKKLEDKSDKLLIQTNIPDNYFFQYLGTNGLKKFYHNELDLRKKYLFPPFSTIIKVIYHNKDEHNTQKEIDKLYQKLSCLKIKNIIISKPTTCWIHMKNNHYRKQIIIKLLKRNNSTNAQLQKVFATLSKDFKIEVDPLSLL